jgi:3-oxoacyl-[acyl-carrier protein] reductase
MTSTVLSDPLSFAGRTVLVTGAAQGIGRAVAEAFAGCGAALALCDRDARTLSDVAGALRAAGAEVVAEDLDVRDPDAFAAFADRVGAELGGRVDVLVNNAGGTYAAPFADSRPKGDEALVRTNLLSVAWCTRAVLPLLGEGGSVVNITSIEAQRAAPLFALYAAAKAGVTNLTQTLALELGDRGIRVNCIAPDVIPTPGIGDLPGAPRTPLVRRGHVDDVAGAALFLASPLAAFITGATIPVDGGNHAAGGWRRAEDGSWVT